MCILCILCSSAKLKKNRKHFNNTFWGRELSQLFLWFIKISITVLYICWILSSVNRCWAGNFCFCCILSTQKWGLFISAFSIGRCVMCSVENIYLFLYPMCPCLCKSVSISWSAFSEKVTGNEITVLCIKKHTLDCMVHFLMSQSLYK